jgi:hypothetical protein
LITDGLTKSTHFIPSTPSAELKNRLRSTSLVCYVGTEFQG